METPFNKALQNDDDLIAIVRSHIYVERLLNKLIDSLLPFPELLSETRIGWPQKVDLALSLGLRPQFGPPLKKIGSIRNRFAHEPDAKITKMDATDLYGSLHEDDRKLVNDSLELIENQSKGKVERVFRDFGARDQFTLMMISLHSMLLVAISNVTGEPIDENT